MFCTYILYSVSYDRYYIGHCENVTARLLRHNSKMVPSTKPYVPWNLMYYEEYHTRPKASNRELEIKKKKSRKYVEWLIANGTGRHVQI
ncbi:MAG: GIY-YIG nuclease family protein [Chitinophagaceae bacterium]|nr:GIY-YIG nuclease family protein [Chitinophagaceae bacterium]